MAWGYPDEPEHVIAGTAMAYQCRAYLFASLSLGIGRLSVLLIAGMLSDRF